MVDIINEVEGEVYGLLDTAVELETTAFVVIALVVIVKTVVVPLMTVTVVLTDVEVEVEIDVVPLFRIGP